MQRPLILYPLLFALLFLSLGGFYGGAAMLLDPTGASLQMTELLPQLPVTNFYLPGLFLLTIMGATPLLLSYGLFTHHHWAWTGTLTLSLILAAWLTLQGCLIGFQWAIQYITAANGALIFLCTIAPPLRRHYVTIKEPITHD